jgi:pimeloyl-ACP methyl ester carboxylesterase
MLTRVAELPDRSIRYLEAGGGKTAVVLLHAFPLSAEQWMPQLSRVPPGLRFIAPDLRGFRGNGPAFEPLDLDGVTMDGYAADVLSLMTHLEIDKAIVAGVSMGGYVGFAMLRRAPARIAGLVLANTRSIPDSAEGKAARDRMIALVERERAAGLAREMLPKLLGATTRQQQPDLVDVVGHLIEANSTAGLVFALRALKDRPDSTPLLASIACPVTIVAGEEDAVIPAAETDAMHRAIVGAELVRLPRVGHLSNLEAPAAFSAVLASFAPKTSRPGRPMQE